MRKGLDNNNKNGSNNNSAAIVSSSSYLRFVIFLLVLSYLYGSYILIVKEEHPNNFDLPSIGWADNYSGGLVHKQQQQHARGNHHRNGEEYKHYIPIYEKLYRLRQSTSSSSPSSSSLPTFILEDDNDKFVFSHYYDGPQQQQKQQYTTTTTADNNNYNLYTDRYGEQRQRCDVTMVYMDPRIGFPSHLYGLGEPGWFALESAAAFAPNNTCVLILTSNCAMEQYLRKTKRRTTIDGKEQLVDVFLSPSTGKKNKNNTKIDNNDNVEDGHNETTLETMVMKKIYDHSLPLFRNMIQKGFVRVSFLDHKKYRLQSCSNYGNPTPALVNVNFWRDEFLVNDDSDTIILFQDDSVVCYPFDVNIWKPYAYVGSVWPVSLENFDSPCYSFRQRWDQWTANGAAAASSSKKATKNNHDNKNNDDYPYNSCRNGTAAQGNGGFSLRSRKWLIKAIETCPYLEFAGLPPSPAVGGNRTCQLNLDDAFINEDLYFSTVLIGIKAPLPNALVASLFSTEMLWPEQVLDLYHYNKDSFHFLDDDNSKEQIISLWKHKAPKLRTTTTNRLRTNNNHHENSVHDNSFETYTVSVGVHKLFWYHPLRLIRSMEMADVCPFQRYTYGYVDKLYSPTLVSPLTPRFMYTLASNIYQWLYRVTS